MSVHIYHEQQESALCGQHCLNNLLQGNIFSAVHLSEIAQELDYAEASIMGGRSGTSSNVDDSGNFSIQVLRMALNRHSGIDLVPLFGGSSGSTDPLAAEGFVVNRAEHWFTLRKVRDKWWNLNSTAERPELISQFYLTAFLTQLKADGYSVFTASGAKLPTGNPNDALFDHRGSGSWYTEEQLLKLSGSSLPPSKPDPFQGKGRKLGDSNESSNTSSDPANFGFGGGVEEDDEDLMLAKAISASLCQTSSQTSSTSNEITSSDKPAEVMDPKAAMRAKRLAALEKQGVK